MTTSNLLMTPQDVVQAFLSDQLHWAERFLVTKRVRVKVLPSIPIKHPSTFLRTENPVGTKVEVPEQVLEIELQLHGISVAEPYCISLQVKELGSSELFWIRINTDGMVLSQTSLAEGDSVKIDADTEWAEDETFQSRKEFFDCFFTPNKGENDDDTTPSEVALHMLAAALKKRETA